MDVDGAQIEEVRGLPDEDSAAKWGSSRSGEMLMTPSGTAIVLVVGTLALSVGCASAPRPDTPHRLVVRAYIDGSDFLMMRRNQIRWVHGNWELPGLDDASEPTFLLPPLRRQTD